MELYQTREEIQHSTDSAFTSIRPQGDYNSRVLFEQDIQLQEQNQELSRTPSGSRDDHPVPKGPNTP